MHGEDTRVTLDTSPELSHTLLAVHFQLIVKHCKDPWAAEASAVAAVPKPHNKARLLWDYLDAVLLIDQKIKQSLSLEVLIQVYYSLA